MAIMNLQLDKAALPSLPIAGKSKIMGKQLDLPNSNSIFISLNEQRNYYSCSKCALKYDNLKVFMKDGKRLRMCSACRGKKNRWYAETFQNNKNNKKTKVLKRNNNSSMSISYFISQQMNSFDDCNPSESSSIDTKNSSERIIINADIFIKEVIELSLSI